MSKAFVVGQRVRVAKDETLVGDEGVVREAFYHRGDENSYRVEMFGEGAAVLSFAESELEDATERKRRRRS